MCCNSFDKSAVYGELVAKRVNLENGFEWNTARGDVWARSQKLLRENARSGGEDDAEAFGGRIILHCDCNCFFASVEMVTHPEYRTVPMAVCGSQADRHGIVLAKNELAKKAGVSTGEVIWQAKLKCPSLVISPPHYALYEQFSREITRIYYDYTDLIEPFGIDESWLDVTGSTRLFGGGIKMADDIRRRVREETGVTVSVGVSFNKTFAKLGSDYKKPDATTVITRSNYKELLYPLPVGDMMYIGRHTVPKLRRLGIYTIGDMPRDSPVSPFAPAAKSYGNGMTFLRDLCGYEDYFAAAAYLAEKACARMRADGARCGVVEVCVRDTALNVITRRKKLPYPVSSTRAVEEAARELLEQNWDLSRPARSVRVCCADISPAPQGEQCKFFYSPAEKQLLRDSRYDAAVDKLRSRFGRDVVTRGSVIKAALIR